MKKERTTKRRAPHIATLYVIELGWLLSRLHLKNRTKGEAGKLLLLMSSTSVLRLILLFRLPAGEHRPLAADSQFADLHLKVTF